MRLFSYWAIAAFILIAFVELLDVHGWSVVVLGSLAGIAAGALASIHDEERKERRR